jgi:hypothetical protein
MPLADGNEKSGERIEENNSKEHCADPLKDTSFTRASGHCES